MDLRIGTPEPGVNGTHRPEKAKRPPAHKPRSSGSNPRRAGAGRPAVRVWALFGVGFMSALSAGLNGYANAQHAPAAWPGWLMGLAVPVIVLTLAKVAGEKWRAGQRRVGALAGGSGAALLFLSVWHCATGWQL